MSAVKKWFAVLFAVVLSVCVFSACGDELPDNTERPLTVKVTVLDLQYQSIYEKELQTEKSSLYELFAELPGLQVRMTVAAFAWVDAVKVVEEDGFTVKEEIAGGMVEETYCFISVFHDIDDILLKDLSRDYDIRYGEKDYYLSGVGVNGLPLVDGASYILKLVGMS